MEFGRFRHYIPKEHLDRPTVGNLNEIRNLKKVLRKIKSYNLKMRCILCVLVIIVLTRPASDDDGEEVQCTLFHATAGGEHQTHDWQQGGSHTTHSQLRTVPAQSKSFIVSSSTSCRSRAKYLLCPSVV